jgi:hypothetical protein
MVRVVALLALVCGAAAVLDASSTPFGASVLAELESKIARGQPLDELKAILADIRQRLNETGAADTEAQKADDIYCDNRKTKLTADIGLENQQIASINASINSDKGVVKAQTAIIDALVIAIADLKTKIDLNIGEQAERKEERANQIEQFFNGSRDVDICVRALDDIQELGGVQKLIDDQNNKASNYTEGVTALLEAVATRVSHPHVLNLVQLASLTTVAAINGGDVDRLNAMLLQLRADLVQYKTDITGDDGVLAGLYVETMKDLVQTKEDDERTKATKESEKENATVKKNSALARIKSNGVELEEAINSKDALVLVLRALNADCLARKSAHLVRITERAEEVKTINKIEDILVEKLGKHMGGGHLEDRLETTVGASEEGRSYPDEESR